MSDLQMYYAAGYRKGVFDTIMWIITLGIMGYGLSRAAGLLP